MTEAWILIGLIALSVSLASLRLLRRFRPIFAAAPSVRTDHPRVRLFGALADFGLHRRLLRFRFAGSYHAVIVISFLCLLTAKIRSFVEILAPQSDVLRWAMPLHDPAVLAMLAAVSAAVVNRLWFGRGRYAGSNQRDAIIILLAITFIVFALEAEAVSHLVAHPLDGALFPLAFALSRLVPASISDQAGTIETTFRWLHISSILAFLVYIPGSKHFHAILGLPQLFLRNIGPRGQLFPGTEIAPPANTISSQSRKALLDLYACSECGRCHASCPAYASGAALNPKSLIMTLRAQLVSTAHGKIPADAPLAGVAIPLESLWACTTCFACMAACPLHIEHVPKIVDLRRSLVEEGQLDASLTAILNSARRYGNVFKRPARQRPKWVEELDFEIPDARESDVDYLWFVGDHASFHPVAISKSQRFAKLLHAANISFGILYAEERSAGNDIRRIGEEDLFQELARQNIDAIKECSFKAVVTMDPHSFNTLLNEYPAFGLQATVLHHTELLADLIESGRLARPAAPKRRVTYHDPCYLGRYNGRFQAARTIIESLGHDLVEMPRNRENSFCCGAGGGRIFMNEVSTHPRPAEIRLREGAEINGVEWFLVACPKDYVMFSDARKSIEISSEVSVKEIVDLFYDENGDIISNLIL